MHREFALTFLLSLTAAPLARAGDAAALWSGRVQPLFDVQCTKCHGVLEQKGGLELDTVEKILKGNDEGPVVAPGKPEESKLYKALAAGSDPHMPPKKQLTDAERDTIREWITALAAAPAPLVKKFTIPGDLKSIEDTVNFAIAAAWSDHHLKPAAEVDEKTWCRRVYLDLAGRIPSRGEMNDFLFSSAPSKRAALVDKLLSSAEYPARMRELWDVLLMGRGKRGGNEDRRQKNGWWTFLEDAFRENRPWNETVRDLIAARPAVPERKGASWFIFERRNEHQQIAEAVAPLVYGTRIDCAQCHDHPLAREIKQGHYWGLVAAFNRSKNVEGTSQVGESAIGGFINFTNLKKESQPAVVTLLTGKTVAETRPDGGKENDSPDKYVDASAKVKVPKFSRREAFAEAATDGNPLLARAFVNRMWAALLGRGIVHPADEMNERNVPSHPELLDWLAKDFETHKYDVKRLVRGIVLSRVYALGSAKGTAPEWFAGALERPLTAEQIARSWRVAAGLPPSDDTLRRAVIGAMPDVMPKEYNATFQQAQFLTNSPALAGILQPASGNTAERLAALPDAAARVKEAFLSVLARTPDDEELKQATAFLNERPDKPADGVRDLLWALMTGAEFLTAP
ncbi:MAG TPA: DUF1549 domain-containing protein [Verrucomicrobiales bacterium]|nr:DUF1549 domain-containing protein [Verrucomicrobiales bacterium]